jgi:AcrR family transcriptional regulator
MARQAERRQATRRAILTAATELFGRQGFAATSMDQIVQAAGVAKGAIYHHYPTKVSLFEAVFRDTSHALAADLAKASLNEAAARSMDTLTAISHGVRAYFAACAEGPVGRIILKDGPAVLGWRRWREIDAEHFGGIFPATLRSAMASGLMRTQPVEPLAQLLLGAATEAAVACHASDDPAATGEAYAQAFEDLLEGLRIHHGDRRKQLPGGK